MYAILSDRGHQYKVREGDLLQIDLMGAKKAGDEVIFDKVLLVGQEDGAVKVGTPNVAGAKVTAVIENHAKADKLIAHHRVRTNSLGTRRGHRTKLTVLKIQKIVG
jgi:large subunit ribosomal protein L21